MIYKGDDTGAFGANFLTISLENAENVTISKAVFRCNEITKEFENPVFPIKINLTAEETSMLYEDNTCYLAVYDEKGLKKTCEGSFVIQTQPKRV